MSFDISLSFLDHFVAIHAFYRILPRVFHADIVYLFNTGALAFNVTVGAILDCKIFYIPKCTTRILANQLSPPCDDTKFEVVAPREKQLLIIFQK